MIRLADSFRAMDAAVSADLQPTPVERGSTVAGDEWNVSIYVDDTVLYLALAHVATERGFTPVNAAEPATLMVADQVRSGHVVDVLVADPSPVRSTIAIGAALAGAARTVISTVEPLALGRALDSVQGAYIAVSMAVAEAARAVPRLTARQHNIMAHVVDGATRDATVASHVGISVATLKREIREICSRVGAGNRSELTEAARTLGYFDGLRALDLML